MLKELLGDLRHPGPVALQDVDQLHEARRVFQDAVRHRHVAVPAPEGGREVLLKVGVVRIAVNSVEELGDGSAAGDDREMTEDVADRVVKSPAAS